MRFYIYIFKYLDSLNCRKRGHSLITQLVKNPSAMQETPVWFLGPEDPLEKGKATHSCILAWRTPWTMLYSPWGHKQSDMTEQLTFKLHKKYIIQSNSAVYTQKNKSNWLYEGDKSAILPPFSISCNVLFKCLEKYTYFLRNSLWHLEGNYRGSGLF